MRSFIHVILAIASLLLCVSANYWLEDIDHQGLAPYAGSGYTVFRNVMDYGAKGKSALYKNLVAQALTTKIGDGVTDDTAAINSAITAGGRCGEGCVRHATTWLYIYYYLHWTGIYYDNTGCRILS